MKLKDIKNKLFGFSTKDLYLAELVRYEEKLFYDKYFFTLTDNYAYHLEPRKYIIARKTYKGYDPKFSDVFTGSLYNVWGVDASALKNKEIVAAPISPIISNKKRIKYKDAEEILYTKNTTYIKKK